MDLELVRILEAASASLKQSGAPHQVGALPATGGTPIHHGNRGGAVAQPVA